MDTVEWVMSGLALVAGTSTVVVSLLATERLDWTAPGFKLNVDGELRGTYGDAWYVLSWIALFLSVLVLAWLLYRWILHCAQGTASAPSAWPLHRFLVLLALSMAITATAALIDLDLIQNYEQYYRGQVDLNYARCPARTVIDPLYNPFSTQASQPTFGCQQLSGVMGELSRGFNAASAGLLGLTGLAWATYYRQQ